ncbi:MAG: class II fructose-bisphosphate aldolase [Clostridia bacterium]|nr:class II fructose-bisphosphate aldolase [Clostridia bacterium]
MLVNLQTILKDADENGYAVPAFNVYNMETVMGIIQAAEELRAPVILQFYSRLATTGFADYLAPIVLRAAEKASVPVCMHLDHGAGYEPAAIALKNGATGIMVDFSTLPLEENIEKTAATVKILSAMNIGVEGEIGHIGSAADGVPTDYTTVEEAKQYVDKTGVSALAVAVGTAHGRYKQAPVLAIDRIKEIKEAIGIPLVLHGGSGVPDDQIRLAVKNGIRKINFGTDVCYSFLDAVFEVDRKTYAIDLFMKEPIEAVKRFAESKIKLLGADERV